MCSVKRMYFLYKSFLVSLLLFLCMRPAHESHLLSHFLSLDSRLSSCAGPKKLEQIAELKIATLDEDGLFNLISTLPEKKGIDSSTDLSLQGGKNKSPSSVLHSPLPSKGASPVADTAGKGLFSSFGQKEGVTGPLPDLEAERDAAVKSDQGYVSNV